MKQLNSKTTFFYKKISPWLLVGIALFYTLPLLTLPFSKLMGGQVLFPLKNSFFYLLFLFVLALNGMIIALACYSSMDYVFDNTDSLQLQKAGQEITLPLSNIKTIVYTHYISFPVIILTTYEDTAFGQTLKFIPKLPLIPFRRHRYIRSLITRIRAQ